MFALLGLWVLFLGHGVVADLPDGCVPLNEQPFSTVDPSTIYEANAELQGVAPPYRIGDWRPDFSIPTQHFAINQVKGTVMAPMRLMPYSATLSNEGVTYDAYTLDRWNATVRSDEMQQQTPSKVGEPWEKVTSLGTNMKQMVSGPDGNPKGDFTGRSGIQVGILGSGDPTWTGFGDMYGDFLFRDNNGGQMEVPMVRGSALLTHRFTNANPVLAPYCLSSVNGQPASFSCPMERNAEDSGEGYISGSCSGGSLIITLRTTKPIDIRTVQHASNTIDAWPGDHGMRTCGDECVMSSNNRRVDITIPDASGTMAFAVNVIGRYIIPSDWVDSPETTSCAMSRSPRFARAGDEKSSQYTGKPCDPEFCYEPSCDIQGNDVTFQLVIDLTEPITGPEAIQFAVNTADDWPSSSPMITCTDPQIQCTVSGDGRTITYSNTFNSERLHYAVNVMGKFLRPPGDWQNSPYVHQCGEEPTGPPVTTTTTSGPGPTPDPEFCSSLPDFPQCPIPFCKNTFCQAIDGANQNFKIIVQLNNPIDSITDVQIAMNTDDNWDSSHPMITCTPDLCTLQPDGRTLTYCTSVPAGAVKYAVNVAGRFIQPPTSWETNPFQYQCGGSGTEIDTGTRFVLELDEPGDALPDQTRKYVIYFSEEMRAISDANGLNFEPLGGGQFTGLMQLAYAGANPRGDLSRTTFFDNYAGVYSYHPVTSYCVQGDTGYINFDWNKHDVNGPTGSGDLLMVTMPHQEPSLQSQGQLLDTPFTFRGFVGDFWLLEEDLPESTMEPDPAGVQRVKDNPQRLQNILDAIDRDVREQNLPGICITSNSYGVGKAISMVARLASISRAFETNHYEELDEQIRTCLEKWLLIDDTLEDGNRFRYDTVYGGLLLRSGPSDEPIHPGANFGFPLYSDHHFHLGYHVYALAYYAKYYTSWADAHRERILLVARDVGNPSFQDKYFPIARHKDFYVGISWATGLVGGLRQEESSTEGIHCYHGLAALGLALGDETMEHFGQLMLATEIRSVREYFHVRAHNRHLFPAHIRDYGVIGQFAEDAIFYYTLNWPCDPFEFPMRHACLVGIQVIPIMSCSKYFMDQEWAGAVKNVCDWSIDPFSAPGAEDVDPDILRPVSLGWGAFCRATTAAYDSQAQDEAEEYVKDLGPGQLVGGTSAAGTLLFIYEST